jgi:protein required for attachment to host cells
MIIHHSKRSIPVGKSMTIVVADKVRARLFRADKPLGPITEIEDFTHPESRLPARELLSDAHGRAFDSAGQGRHAMETDVDPRRQEALRFATELARELDKKRVRHEFDCLGLVAAPEFLGLLRDALSEQCRALVCLEVDKDLTHLEQAAQIRSHLPEKLYSAL